MTLLLGIYSRKGKSDKAIINPIIEDFSKARAIVSISNNKFVLAGFSNNNSFKNIYESADRNIISGISGNIYFPENPEKNISIKELTDKYLIKKDFFIKGIEGTFTLSIHNIIEDTLLIANDPFGLYPLFWYADDDYIIFCNEYEPILKYKNFNPELDEVAIAEYFICGSPLGNKTFFKNIKNLYPSSILKVEKNSISISEYYWEKPVIEKKKNIDDFAADFAFLFKKAVTRCTQNKEEIQCSLTGGIDSRLVLSAMEENIRKKTKFFTLLTPPLSEVSDRDVAIAKIISEKCKIDLTIKPLNYWTTIWTENFSSNYFTNVRHRDIGEIITGYYGSEIVKGEFIKIIPAGIKSKIEKKQNFLKKIHSLFLTNKATIETSKILSHNFSKTKHLVQENLNSEFNKIYCENKELLFSINFLTRGFFTSIYSGSFGSWLTPYKFPLEMQMPFMDTALLKLYLSIPLKILLNPDEKLYNAIYKNHFPELTTIPTSSWFGSIPGNCIQSYSLGTEPKNEKRPMYKIAYSEILKNGLLSQNIFDLEKIHTFTNLENNQDIRQFIEFEIWLKYIHKL